MHGRSSLTVLFGVLALVAHCQAEDALDFNPPEEVEDDDTPPESSDDYEEGEAEHEVDGPPDEERLKLVLEAMDLNQDGKVGMDEMYKFTMKLRMASSKKDIATTIEEMDTNKDGKLSEGEYIQDMEIEDHETLSEKEKAEHARHIDTERAKFAAADSNKDGLLDKDELPMMTNPELFDDVLTVVSEHELKSKDHDSNGELTLKEFWSTDSESEIDPKMVDEFESLDKDKSGRLSLNEYKAYVGGMHHLEAVFKKILEVADKDKDHHVTHEEFGSPELHGHGEVVSHFWEWAEGLSEHGDAKHGGEL